MKSTGEFVVTSLELHLFFARIMKEHAFFLKAGFLPCNIGLAGEAERLMRHFERLLARTISLSGGLIRDCVLESGEIVTEFTDCAEQQTMRLTGTFIDRKLTAAEKRLKGCGCCDELCVSAEMERQVRQLNRDGLMLVNRLIEFKKRLLRSIGSCNLFTANYPLLIEHIFREACLYRDYLVKLQQGDCDLTGLFRDELFWNRIMMEHALFIRGLLDPSEEELIGKADGFASDYRRLLSASAAANDRAMPGRGRDPLTLTRRLRDFKQAGVEGIEKCEIRSLILPLLVDHVLREANHYIRLLEN